MRSLRPLAIALAAIVTIIGLCPASIAADSAKTTSWLWPLTPEPAVTRAFDPPAKPWLSGHRGVDLAAFDGQEVRSPAAGIVSFLGWLVDRNVLTIDHGNGLRSSFEPVLATVKLGEHIDRGQIIATVQPGHRPPSVSLHWGARREENYLNPLLFIQDRRPSILLPLRN